MKNNSERQWAGVRPFAPNDPMVYMAGHSTRWAAITHMVWVFGYKVWKSTDGLSWTIFTGDILTEHALRGRLWRRLKRRGYGVVKVTMTVTKGWDR